MFLAIRTPATVPSQVDASTQWEVYAAPYETEEAALGAIDTAPADTLGTFIILDLSTRKVASTAVRSVTVVRNPRGQG